MQSKWNYLIKGQGEPLVFSHGVLGLSQNFRTAAKSLEQDYSCLLYDQRGHGKSFHSQPYTVNQLAEDIKILIEEIGFHKIFLLGHSLGGFASLLFADKYPEKLYKLIIVDISPEPSKNLAQGIIDRIKRLPDSFSSLSQARDYLKQAVKQGHLPQDMAGLLSINLEQKETVTQFCFNKPGLIQFIQDARNYNYWSVIKNLKCPTLYMRGENSMHLPQETFHKILQSNPIVQGVEIKKAGHLLHHQQPQDFIKAVRQFLN